jgi:hypothetical protein
MGERNRKPLGGKAYGSIPHLPGSRRGPGDHCCHEGQAVICTVRGRDRHDRIIVQEKLDGSCVAVAKVDGRILALTRAGYEAHTSSWEQHQLFEAWVWECAYERFDRVLLEGERICGEWLAQAHGTRYELTHDPFVAFDLLADGVRAPFDVFNERMAAGRFVTPRLIHDGESIAIQAVLARLEPSGHGALDPVEGAVWRVERRGKVDFLTKYVRPDKLDGLYLPEVSGGPSIWNWRPRSRAEGRP